MMLGCFRPSVSATSHGVPSGVRLMLLCLSDGMTCRCRSKLWGCTQKMTDWCSKQRGQVSSSLDAQHCSQMGFSR